MGDSLQGPEIGSQPKSPPVSGPGSFCPLCPAVFWREEFALCPEQTLAQAWEGGSSWEKSGRQLVEERELGVPQTRTLASPQRQYVLSWTPSSVPRNF